MIVIIKNYTNFTIRKVDESLFYRRITNVTTLNIHIDYEKGD